MSIWCVVNVNATDMKELILSRHVDHANARWAEAAMAAYSVETEVVKYDEKTMARIEAQMEIIEEMRENLRTGIRRSARASAASRSVN